MKILSQAIPSGANVHKNFLPLLRCIPGLTAMVYLILASNLLKGMLLKMAETIMAMGSIFPNQLQDA